MSMVISGSAVNNDILLQISHFLDARAKASFSQACKYFREIINSTGLTLSMLGFNLCLTDELFLTEFYKKELASADVEAFKANVGNHWFGYLSGTDTVPLEVLTSAINCLVAERKWSAVKIKKLCHIFKCDVVSPDVLR